MGAYAEVYVFDHRRYRDEVVPALRELLRAAGSWATVGVPADDPVRTLLDDLGLRGALVGAMFSNGDGVHGRRRACPRRSAASSSPLDELYVADARSRVRPWKFAVRGRPDPLPIVATANELLALRDRPRITRTTVEGDLGSPA